MKLRQLRDRITAARARCQPHGTQDRDAADTVLVLATLILAPDSLAIPLLALGCTRVTAEHAGRQAPPAGPHPGTRAGRP